MKTVSRTKIQRCYDDGGKVLRHVRYERCDFESCRFSITLDPTNRSVLEDLEFINCSVRGTDIEAAVVKGVVVDGLRTYGMLQTWGAVFERTVLRGKIDRVMISPTIQPGIAGPDVQRSFDQANEEFYSGVDWALDIREAEAKELDLRGVPGHLVRRDPETQVLVTREAAIAGGWRDLPLDDTYWPVAIENLILEGLDSCVLVAPKRDRNFKRLLNGLRLLREAGVAT